MYIHTYVRRCTYIHAYIHSYRFCFIRGRQPMIFIYITMCCNSLINSTSFIKITVQHSDFFIILRILHSYIFILSLVFYYAVLNFFSVELLTYVP